MQKEKIAVVLIGHGAPATDCPPQWVGELMGLQWRGNHGHFDSSKRAEELDAKIRDWPRDADNDPYKTGLEKVAARLKEQLPGIPLMIGYNEFCRPSIHQALEEVVKQGAGRILVIPSMLTPGGVHSEVDIPRALAKVQKAYPQVKVEYLWPFEVSAVAGLLAMQVKKVLAGDGATTSSETGRPATGRSPLPQ